MHITPIEELVIRKEGLQRLLRDKGIDGAIILQRADIFYFSGTGQDGHLLIPASGESVLLARKSFDRARQESRLPVVEKFPRSKELPGPSVRISVTSERSEWNWMLCPQITTCAFGLCFRTRRSLTFRL